MEPIDVIATDHAPHSYEEKSKGSFTPFDGKDAYGVRKLTLMKGNRYEIKR